MCVCPCLFFFLTSSQIASAPTGVQVATLDIKKAYRTIPIRLQDKKFLVVAHWGEFWLDHVAPFGLATAAGLQGEVADAVMDIWAALGVYPAAKWVDNVTLFRLPSPSVLPDDAGPFHYRYDREWAKALIAPLGVPWHPSKGQEFDFDFSYVGFRWDIPTRTIRLTEDKHRKIIAKIQAFLDDFERR